LCYYFGFDPFEEREEKKGFATKRKTREGGCRLAAYI
jgi:hypothetical protein